MEYYLAIKRNEALMHAATGMNLENIMFNEVTGDHILSDFIYNVQKI